MPSSSVGSNRLPWSHLIGTGQMSAEAWWGDEPAVIQEMCIGAELRVKCRVLVGIRLHCMHRSISSAKPRPICMLMHVDEASFIPVHNNKGSHQRRQVMSSIKDIRVVWG